MFFSFVLAFFGVLLVFLEFFLPGMIMAIGGGILLLASLFVFHMQHPSSVLFLMYFCLLAAVVWGTIYLALWMIRDSAKKGTLCLNADQKGFKATFFDQDLVGKKGKAVTDLRPSGHIIVDGSLRQAVSKTGYIEKESAVIVDGGNGGHLVVKTCGNEAMKENHSWE